LFPIFRISSFTSSTALNCVQSIAGGCGEKCGIEEEFWWPVCSIRSETYCWT
jgi:hypothetical protein